MQNSIFQNVKHFLTRIKRMGRRFTYYKLNYKIKTCVKVDTLMVLDGINHLVENEVLEVGKSKLKAT